MESISSLHLLAEAVRSAGADIAPTYQEYIQLAFAIANDCGEAGRPNFLALCSPSPKYDPQAADKLFSNALKTGRNDVHIGSVFHLAELCGVKVHPETPPAIGTLGTQGSPGSSSSHTRVREDDPAPDSDPLAPLPTFDEHIHWPIRWSASQNAVPPVPNTTFFCWVPSPCWVPAWDSMCEVPMAEK